MKTLHLLVQGVKITLAAVLWIFLLCLVLLIGKSIFFSKPNENVLLSLNHAKRGDSLFLLISDNNGAITEYTKAIDLYSKDGRSWGDKWMSHNFHFRGKCFAELGNYKSAIVDFSTAIDLNPKNKEIFFDRANSKWILNDFSGSIKDCNEIIKNDSENKDAFLLRGLMYHRLSNKENDFVLKHLGCIDLERARQLGSDRAEFFLAEYCIK